jgi:para-aminobenzoate synthetase component 1
MDKIISAPIKGTSSRSDNKIIDKNNLQYLQNSKKEKAENLMIVDLMRNDLSRNCQINSVHTQNLFQIISFKKIHHMVSKIIGQKSPDKNNIDVIKGCFPPGSMTGAPKIKAMEICDNLEKIKRGIYSGAIGLISHNICKLSVVIRTLIIFDDKFEFQSGGAITYDSKPKKELQESKDKNKAILEIIQKVKNIP